MAEKVEMIQLSPTMEEGVVVEWLMKEGDSVSTGDLIAEIETDKATMEMESYFDGTLLRILVPAGQSARVGTTLAIIGEPGEDIDHLVASSASAPTDDDGDDEREATARRTEKPDDSDQREDGAEREASGDRRAADEGDRSPGPRGSGERVFASPVARSIARAEGLALERISGSGPQGRIIKRDVEQALRDGSATASPSRPAPSSAAAPASRTRAAEQPRRGEHASAETPAERVALSPMRKAIARNLAQAWQAPAFMLTRTIRMDALLALRRQINDAGDGDGGPRVSVNDLLIRGCALALGDVPDMNVAWDDDAILRYQRADIGVAVAIEGGLITPIVRDAGQLPVGTIARRMKDLAERARDRKLQPDEFTGATFSISNLGMFGIDHFTAVLNPPAAGILAVGATRAVPVVGDDGAVTTEQQMSVTLTCDHRAVDGATGALFLQALTRYLERPLLMLV